MSDRVFENSGRKENKDKSAYVVTSSVVGIIANVLLFVLKLVTGIFSSSISITADAVNNLSDAGSSVIALIGIRLSKRPPDKKHPFGHGRLEYIAALIVAIIIIQVGLSFFKESVIRILHPLTVKADLSVPVILGISIVVKIGLYLFNKRIYALGKSYIVKTVAADCLSDAIITFVIFIPFILKYFGHNFQIDGLMGVVVAVMVIKTGAELTMETLNPLIGQSVSKEEYEALRNMVSGYEGILGVHDLILHHYGENYKMATIHVEVDRYADIQEIHEIIDEIEKDVKQRLGIFLVIHMDPSETQDEEILSLRKDVEHLVCSIDPSVSIHDFRAVKTLENINLYFDLLVPYEYNEIKESKLVFFIDDEVKKINHRCKCFINVDKSYIDL